MSVRLRQAVLAARDLDAVADRLRAELALGEPFADPGVAHFGLRNAVFAVGDTFLEVVSPVQAGTAAGRFLERRDGDGGYMLMFETDDLASARERARDLGVREVFQVELDDIAEVHLHPADLPGPIVAVSEPKPAGSWRWGGPEWRQRSAPGALVGVTVAAPDPERVAARWAEVLGEQPPGVTFSASERVGLTAIRVAGERATTEIGGVAFSFGQAAAV
jgi:hypothetical protein